MTARPKAGIFCVALCFYIIFLFLWTVSHELSDMRLIRYPLHFEWERTIKFQSWALPFYLSLDIAVIIFPFLFRSWKEAIAPIGTLLAQTAIASIFFVLVPIEPSYETNGVWGPYFYDYLNMDNMSRWNHAPSLHVSYVFTIGWIIGQRFGAISLCLSMIWAALVSISTLLVHEHHVLCVTSGFVLFLFTIISVYPALLRKYDDSTSCTIARGST